MAEEVPHLLLPIEETAHKVPMIIQTEEAVHKHEIVLIIQTEDQTLQQTEHTTIATTHHQEATLLALHAQ